MANVVVEALAGTGKTTTAVGCLGVGLKGRVGFAAFNNHIAAELTRRLPPEVPAATLHAMGMAAVRRAFPHLRDPEQAKLGRISRELAPGAFPNVRITAERLARLCKYTLTPERDASQLAGLVEYYGVDIDDRDRDLVFQLTGNLVKKSIEDLSTIDFDDMIWLPIRLGLPMEQFDLLLLDEAQDLNRTQHHLALSATKSGRLIPIGDRNQAIYGFSGADCDSLPRLKSSLEERANGCELSPLTVTWRCPSSHVEIAQRIVPALEAAPNARDGEIKTASLQEITRSTRPGDLVIARRNAVLVSLTYRLVLAGVPALMRGREIGQGMILLIRRLKPDSISDLVDRIEDYREKELRRLRKRNADEREMEVVNDKCDCLGQLASQATSLEQLEIFIESRFDNDATPDQCVVLSSVHRAKGLESNTVYVLDTKSLPLQQKNQKAWEMVQERNICYIAATRSKNSLVFENEIPSIFRR